MARNELKLVLNLFCLFFFWPVLQCTKCFFAKTPKRLKLAVSSVHFQLDQNVKLKNSEACNSLPNDTFLPELRTAMNQTWVQGSTHATELSVDRPGYLTK